MRSRSRGRSPHHPRRNSREYPAERFYRDALDMRIRVLGHDHPETAVTRNNLAGIFYQRRQFEKAEPLRALVFGLCAC